MFVACIFNSFRHSMEFKVYRKESKTKISSQQKNKTTNNASKPKSIFSFLFFPLTPDFKIKCLQTLGDCKQRTYFLPVIAAKYWKMVLPLFTLSARVEEIFMFTYRVHKNDTEAERQLNEKFKKSRLVSAYSMARTGFWSNHIDRRYAAVLQ